LEKNTSTPKTRPTPGKAASISGFKKSLKGSQCEPVPKPIYLEAQAAAAIALYLRAGQQPPSSIVNAKTMDTSSNTEVPSSYLTPTWVTEDNMASTVVKDKAVKVSELCVSQVASACKTAGIQ